MRKYEGKFVEPLAMAQQEVKNGPWKHHVTKKEHAKLQSLVFQKVCQALTDAKIPFDMVWCTREKFSDVRVSLIVKGIKYVREINKKRREK